MPAPRTRSASRTAWRPGASAVDVGGAPALAASSEDTLVHLATQLGVDFLLALDLRRLADVARLVDAGLDWDGMVTIARGAGAAGFVHLALALAAGLGAAVPSRVLHRLESSAAGCGLASELLADPNLPFRRRVPRTAALVALYPLLYARLRTRLGVVLTLPFPSYGSLGHVQLVRAGDPSGDGAGPVRAYLRRLRLIATAGAAAGALAAAALAALLGQPGPIRWARRLLWREAGAAERGVTARARPAAR